MYLTSTSLWPYWHFPRDWTYFTWVWRVSLRVSADAAWPEGTSPLPPSVPSHTCLTVSVCLMSAAALWMNDIMMPSFSTLLQCQGSHDALWNEKNTGPQAQHGVLLTERSSDSFQVWHLPCLLSPLPSLLLPFPQIKIRNFKQEGLVPLTWVNVLGIINNFP